MIKQSQAFPAIYHKSGVWKFRKVLSFRGETLWGRGYRRYITRIRFTRFSNDMSLGCYRQIIWHFLDLNCPCLSVTFFIILGIGNRSKFSPVVHLLTVDIVVSGISSNFPVWDCLHMLFSPPSHNLWTINPDTPCSILFYHVYSTWSIRLY